MKNFPMKLMRLDEIRTGPNSQMWEAISSANTNKVLRSIQKTLSMQGSSINNMMDQRSSERQEFQTQ